MAAIRRRAGTSERGLPASGAVPCGACVVILMLMGSGPRFLHRELKGRLANASPSRLLGLYTISLQDVSSMALPGERRRRAAGPRAQHCSGRCLARARGGSTWAQMTPATVFVEPPTVAG